MNISSLAGRSALAYEETYSASKAGLFGFTVSLRASYRGSGVSASAICPGLIKGVGMFQRIQDATGVKTPIYGASPAEKVALAVVQAIKQDLPEVIFNPIPIRPLLALQALFPRLTERFGIDEFKEAAQIAQRQCQPTSEHVLT